MRLREAGVSVALAVTLTVTGCSPYRAERNAAEEKTLVATAQGVDGVISAEYDISSDFEGTTCQGRIVVEGSTEEEILAVGEAVLRAFAGNPELSDWANVCGEFSSSDGSISLSIYKFVPSSNSVINLRDFYDIRP